MSELAEAFPCLTIKTIPPGKGYGGGRLVGYSCTPLLNQFPKL